MSETAINHNPEQHAPQSDDTHQLVDMLTSEEILSIRTQSIADAIAGDQAVAELDHLKSEKLELTRQFYQAAGDEQNTINDRIQSLNDSIGDADQAAHDKYADLSERRWRIEHNSLLLRPGELEADKLIDRIAHAPVFQDTDPDNAPIRNYMKNAEPTADGNQKWQVVDDEKVKQHLNNRIFYDTSSLNRRSGDQPRVIIKAAKDQPLEVPLDIVIHAAGFDSWQGRQGAHSGKDVAGEFAKHYDRKIDSLDVIKHYAALPSELPAVSELNLYVQPNGVIFADNGEGDSHRIAAAILRGQPTIKTDSIKIRNIDENIFEPLGDRQKPDKATDWEEVERLAEALKLDRDPAVRATDIAAMTANDLVALVTLLHKSLAPNAGPNPIDKRMKMISPDKSVQHELMDPEDRYALFDHAASLINKLGQQITKGGEADFLKRAANIIALATVIAHPFEDGNGRTARTAAYLFRYGPPKTKEDSDDLKLVGSNRTTDDSGIRLLGFVPRYGDMNGQEFLTAIAALDIPVRDDQTYEEYRKRAGALFTSTFSD